MLASYREDATHLAAVSLGLQGTSYVTFSLSEDKLWVLSSHLETDAHRQDLGFI